MEFLRTWTEAFETWSFEIERLIGVGDDRVVALLHQSGTGKGSGVPVDLNFAAVHRFQDGRMVETRLHMNPADALESAGVSTLYAGVSTRTSRAGWKDLPTHGTRTSSTRPAISALTSTPTKR